MLVTDRLLWLREAQNLATNCPRLSSLYLLPGRTIPS